MSIHLKEINEAMNRNSSKDWTPTIKKIKEQLALRAMSCIQLAHKLINSNDVTTKIYHFNSILKTFLILFFC
jgi:hypothetical protein